MAAYALWAGITLLALLLLAGWWRARSDGSRPVARALWAGVGTVVAVGINQPVAHLVGRLRPYDVLAHVEVLVPRANDFTFPSDHATAAGAVICGLFLAKRWRLAWSALVVGAFLAFARVYVGAHYPGDVLAGLVLGAVVTAALFPLATSMLSFLTRAIDAAPLWPLVAARSTHAAPRTSLPTRVQR